MSGRRWQTIRAITYEGIGDCFVFVSAAYHRLAAERVVRLGGPQNRHGSGLATSSSSSSSSLCTYDAAPDTHICVHESTDTDGRIRFSRCALRARLCVWRRGRERRGWWNSQNGTIRLESSGRLFHMRGISLPARLSPPSGRTIRTRDNYCNYSARNSRAESAQGYVKSRPFPCKCPLARFHALLASCVLGSRACLRNT